MPRRGRKKKAKRLQEFREKRGLSKAELARQAGLDPNTVGRAEAQHPITWRTAHAMANVLAVHTTVLLGGRDVWEEELESTQPWEQTVAQELHHGGRSPRFI